MQRIGEALGVNKATVSRDVSNCCVVQQLKSHAKSASNPKGAGRPKSAPKAKAAAAPPKPKGGPQLARAKGRPTLSELPRLGPSKVQGVAPSRDPQALPPGVTATRGLARGCPSAFYSWRPSCSDRRGLQASTVCFRRRRSFCSGERARRYRFGSAGRRCGVRGGCRRLGGATSGGGGSGHSRTQS